MKKTIVNLITGEQSVVDLTAEEIAEIQNAPPPPPTDYTAMRLQAYRDESDPLFFKWQRGEIEKQVWLDKVAEIKSRWTA